MDGMNPSQQHSEQDQQAEPEQVTEDSEFAPLRAHSRKPVLWSARAETAAGAVSCIALDLSLGGAKLRLSSPLAKAQTVTLVIERIGSLRAEVKWCAQDGGIHSAGVHFTDPPDLIARMLRRALPV
jgi:hypothetical protein